MSRKDALLKLYQRLVAKRDELLETLGYGTGQCDAEVGDSADVASDSAMIELNTQLASIETRELHLVERAIEQLRTGRYGSCDGCGSAIPVARLQALPYTATCVKCSERQEHADQDIDADWEQASYYEGRMNDDEIKLEKMRFKFDE